MNQIKIGRRYVYPNSFILVLSYIKTYFHLSYRQTEGLIKAVGKELSSNPSYSQINRRVNQLSIKIESNEKDDDDDGYVIIAIDSTGIKVTNRGQWMRDKWNVKKKGYLKIHLAVNIKTKEILSLEVTDEKVHDSKLMCKLIGNIESKSKIGEVFADGAYDTNANFAYLSSSQIVSMIRIRVNAVIPKRNFHSRSKAALLQQQRDWKKVIGYGKRWVAETAFSTFKRMFGEYVSAVQFENMVKELMVKVSLCNLFRNIV